VNNLLASGFIENDSTTKQVVLNWLTEYTIGLINAITGYTLDYNEIRP
jgi:hypothetical protein